MNFATLGTGLLKSFATPLTYSKLFYDIAHIVLYEYLYDSKFDHTSTPGKCASDFVDIYDVD